MTPTLMAPTVGTFRSLRENKKSLLTSALIYLVAIFVLSLIPLINVVASLAAAALLAPTVIALTTSEYAGTSFRDAFAYTKGSITSTAATALLWLFIAMTAVVIFFLTVTAILTSLPSDSVATTGNVTVTVAAVLLGIALVAVSVLAGFSVAAAAMNYRSPLKVGFAVARRFRAVLAYLITLVVMFLLMLIPVVMMLGAFLLAYGNTSPDGTIPAGIWLLGLASLVMFAIITPLVFIIQMGAASSIVRSYTAVPILKP